MSQRATAIAAAFAIFACENASAPVDPVWGKQACASCTMLVSDPRFAAELSTRDGARVFFDDPGCMASWLLDHSGQARREWVRSAAATWIDAPSARYARGQSSPMSYGFAPAESGDAVWSDIEAEARRRATDGTSPAPPALGRNSVDRRAP